MYKVSWIAFKTIPMCALWYSVVFVVIYTSHLRASQTFLEVVKMIAMRCFQNNWFLIASPFSAHLLYAKSVTDGRKSMFPRMGIALDRAIDPFNCFWALFQIFSVCLTQMLLIHIFFFWACWLRNGRVDIDIPVKEFCSIDNHPVSSSLVTHGTIAQSWAAYC